MPSPLLLAPLFAAALVLHVETGESMWLRYAPLDPAALRHARETTPRSSKAPKTGCKAVSSDLPACSASFPYRGAPGWCTIRVEYFDQNNGVSRFRLFVGEQKVDQWAASDRLPSAKIDGTTSTCREISGIALRSGDLVRIEAVPGAGEPAPLDYIDILPDSVSERSPPAPRPPRSPRPSPSR